MAAPDLNAILQQVSAARAGGKPIKFTYKGQPIGGGSFGGGSRIDPALLASFKVQPGGGAQSQPLQAPKTYNFGESLLNLLGIGSTITSGATERLLNAQDRDKRLGAGQGTDEDIAWKAEQGTLPGLIGNIGDVLAAPFQGPADTISNLFGGTPSSQLPTWSKNIQRMVDADPNASEGFFSDNTGGPNGGTLEGAGEKKIAAVGLGLDILTDPTTYVTLGAGGAIKGAITGAARAGTTEGRAAVRASQAAEGLGAVGTPLDRAVTVGDRLAGAGEGALAGFKAEGGQVPILDMIRNGRARSAARKQGAVDYTDGLRASNDGGSTIGQRQADTQAEVDVMSALGESAPTVARVADEAMQADAGVAKAMSDSIDEAAEPAIVAPKGKKADPFGAYSGDELKPVGTATREQLDGPLGVATDTYGKGTQGSLRAVKPFEEKAVVKPLADLGAKGERDRMGALVSFYKADKAGATLSGPRAALKPQLDQLKRTSYKVSDLVEEFPNLHAFFKAPRRSIGGHGESSVIRGEDLLRWLSSDAFGSAVRRGPGPVHTGADRFAELMNVSRESAQETLRAADSEARELLQRLVSRADGKALVGKTTLTPQTQRDLWAVKLNELLEKVKRGAPGVPEGWAAKTALQLSKISDPDELAGKLEEIASTVHQRSHRIPKDFFAYLQNHTAQEVLQRIDAAALRDFARTIGLDVKGNTMTVVKALRERGYVSYNEAIAAEKSAAKAFGDATLAGHDLITAGVKAIGDNVEPLKVKTAETARASLASLDEADAAALVTAVNAALADNLQRGGKKLMATKGGELFTKVQQRAADGTTFDRQIVQRVEDGTEYTIWRNIVSHVSDMAEAKGISTAARPAFMEANTMRLMKASDDYLRARGMVPTSRMRDAEKSFRGGGNRHKNEIAFLSIHDVLEELPTEVRRALFFTGKDNNLPVTLLQAMGRWAIRRYQAPTEAMAQSMAVARNSYAQKLIQSTVKSFWKHDKRKAAQFAAAMDDLLRKPDAVANLTKKHVDNAVLARAVWADSAESASMGVRNAFRKSMENPALPVGAKIEDILAYSSKVSKALDQAGLSEDLLQDMARWDTSILMGRLVDADMFYTTRAAARRSAAQVSDSGKAMTDADVAQLMRELGDESIETAMERAKPGSTNRKLVDTKRTLAAREGEARSGRVLLADAEPDIQDITANAMEALVREAPDLADEVTAQAVRYDLQFQLGFTNKTAQKLLTTFKRGFGMDQSNMIRVMANFSPNAQTARFNAGLKALGAKHGGDPATLTSAFRLLQDSDIPVKLPDGTTVSGQTVMAEYAQAVKALAEGAAAPEAVQLAREGLEAALRQAGGAEVSESVLEAAVDLWPMVGEVFDSSAHGLFARAGNNGDDINAILRALQATDADGNPLEMYGGFHFTRNGAPGDLVASWRGIGRGGEAIDPVEILRSTHAALQHATVAPTIAAGFSREFGHEAFGYTFAEAAAKGWARPPTKETGKPFLKYLDPDQLYSPEMLSELKYMDDTLNAIRRPGDSSELLGKVFEKVDPIVSALKSSITIWRPGHWMTNIMGEAWMNVFAGVYNPVHYGTAMKILAKNHKIADFDASLIDDYLSKNAPAGMQARPVTDSEDVIEMMIGGKMQKVPADLIYRGAESRGIILHHAQADDVVIDPAANTAIQSGRKPFQSVRDVNRLLGRGSVARDSAFRFAHAVNELKKGSFRSLDDALDQAASKVHLWHPSYQTLTPFDQVWTRRFIYFYTWQRQAIARMFELSLNMPSMAALPSRVQYAIAYANGNDPESIGNPVNQNELYPDYAANSYTGSPLNIDGQMYGMSLNAPTLDIFSQLFGRLDYDPTLSPADNLAASGGAALRQNVGQMLTPAISVPFQVLNDRTSRGDSYDAQAGAQGRLENLIDQTGASYPSKITGMTVPGLTRTDAEDDPAEQANKQLLALLNSISGLKISQQSNEDSASTATRDERDRFSRWLAQQPLP